MDPAFEWIWRAWHRLGCDRETVGVGFAGIIVRRIPWTTLRAWCDWHGHGPADLALLDSCVLALDKEFIEWVRNRMGGAAA